MKRVFNEVDWSYQVHDSIKFHSLEDERGKHIKHFTGLTGVNIDEVYATVNHKNTVRGYHASFNQLKFVQVLSGKAKVVIESLGQIIFDEIIDNTHPPLIIRYGQFWGYKALEDNTIMSYVVDGKYDPEQESTVNPKSFNNLLEVDENCIVSEKDNSADFMLLPGVKELAEGDYIVF